MPNVIINRYGETQGTISFWMFCICTWKSRAHETASSSLLAKNRQTLFYILEDILYQVSKWMMKCLSYSYNIYSYLYGIFLPYQMPQRYSLEMGICLNRPQGNDKRSLQANSIVCAKSIWVSYECGRCMRRVVYDVLLFMLYWHIHGWHCNEVYIHHIHLLKLKHFELYYNST